MTEKRCWIGIDTSNYTTSFALCNDRGEIIANLKRPLEVKEGERGLRQSDAVFSHIKNIPLLSDSIREAVLGCRVCAVGVSVRPRDAEGSYMPCFMTGKAAAEAIAAVCGVPIYHFSHQSGHIMAALYSCKMTDELLKRDFIAFHVSGGTTEALHVKPSQDGFSVSIIGETADISVGQAIDRAGVMMGIKFPCGAELEALASLYRGDLPRAGVCVREGRCNLSGLENSASALYAESGDKAKVAAFVLDFAGRTIEKMTDRARELYPDAPIIYAGGVMGNKLLQERLKKYANVYFAEPQFSSDNAAGIALLAKRKFENI